MEIEIKQLADCMRKNILINSIHECIKNGKRLLDDAQWCEHLNPASTPYALTLISEEEFAKAFLLVLVEKDIIPWNRFIWRAARDHKCKQLLMIIMDHLNPEFEELLSRYKSLPEYRQQGRTMPAHIADALNIFRHEKIGRMESDHWFWEEEPEYDQHVKKISEGSIDRVRQRQFYTEIGKDGSFVATPLATLEEYLEERERAERLLSLLIGMVEEDRTAYYEYDEITNGFRLLFENMATLE